MKILIVEDEWSIAEILKRQLEPLHLEIEIAITAKEMFAALSKVPPPEIMTLDLGLPDTDSPDATLKLIQNIKLSNPHLSVIVLTGHFGYLEKSRAAGADYHFTKQEVMGEGKQTFFDIMRRLVSAPPAFEQSVQRLENHVKGQTA